MKQTEKQGKTAICGATLIDGNGGNPVPDSLVLIEDGKFTYAGVRKELELSDYRIVEGAGMTLVPGLVECHVHLGGAEGGSAFDWILEEDRLQVMRSVNQAKAMLNHGFTTVRDISKNGLWLKKLIEKGELQGPRIYACGAGLSRTGGHGDCLRLPPEFINRHHPWAVLADGEEEVRKAVRGLLKEGSDWIKLWVTGGGLWENERETDQHYTLREIVAAVEEAALFGVETCAHCESLAGTKAALSAGVRSIEHGEELSEECVNWMKEGGTFLVPTLVVLFDWFEREGPVYRPILDQFPGDTLSEKEINRIIDNFQRAKRAGVKFAVGADSFCNSLTPYGEYSLKELYSLVRAGCTEMEVIVAATKWGAELLGMEGKIGTIEPGKCADLILMKKNPLSDIKHFNRGNYKLIMKDGMDEFS